MRYVPAIAALLGIVAIVTGIAGQWGPWIAAIVGGVLLVLSAVAIAAAGRPVKESGQ